MKALVGVLFVGLVGINVSLYNAAYQLKWIEDEAGDIEQQLIQLNAEVGVLTNLLEAGNDVNEEQLTIIGTKIGILTNEIDLLTKD